MAKTYQPTLRALLHQIDVFIARYQDALLAGLSPEQAVAFATFMAGLQGFREALGQAPIQP